MFFACQSGCYFHFSMNTRSTLLLTGFLIFFGLQICAQTYDFEDAAIPADWQGDRTHFQISATNQLQLNAPAGSTASSLFWPSIATQDCSWEFYTNYTFAASTTNYAAFYLFSTGMDATSASNAAYYIKIGGASGSTDKIELIYQQGTVKQTVLESRSGIVGGSQVSCRIQVLKSSSGLWELRADTTGEHNYTKEASAQHWVAHPFKYSGIRCSYSSTRRDKFYFDDIFICEPFTMQRYHFENDSLLKIYFTQVIVISPQLLIDIDFNESYEIQNDSNCLVIRFLQRIPSGTYRGTISNIFSIKGDSLIDIPLEVVKELIYYAGMLRFSEWMSDPSPSYGLPEVEWVELVNMSDEPVDLNKISIADPSSKARLPSYVLNPDSVVIVCSLNTCNRFLTQNCIEVNTLPGLNNSSDSIFIWANDSLLVDFIEYDVAALESSFKSDGGYSMVRNEFPEECFLSQKIDFAHDNIGGSPGTLSEIIIHTVPAIETKVLSDKEVTIKMNARAVGWDTAFYAAMGVTNATNNAYAYGTSYTLHLNKALEAGDAYAFNIDSIVTCRNRTKYIGAAVEIIYPKQIEKNDVFVNEILYNPNSGGVDFIELYNYSSKYIQLQDSHFYNETNGVFQHVYVPENNIIGPFGFMVFTSDTVILKREYVNTISRNTFQLTHFLSLPDAGGEITWINQNGDTLDQVYYGDDYQNALLRDTEGYSVEKISSSDPYFYSANWTSSAVRATPGFKNSQQLPANVVQQKSFYCNPCHVTTNLNGINDVVLLHLEEISQGSFGSIRIYRISGEKVADLIVNQPLGSANAFQWNGQQQGGGLLEDGIYIAVAEWWSFNGQTFISKIAISTSQY